MGLGRLTFETGTPALPVIGACERLRAILSAHHDHQIRDGAQAVDGDDDLRPALADTLLRAVDLGEVRASADLDSFLDTLLAIYAWTWRGAGPALAETLTGLMDQQVSLLFAGIAA